MRSNRYHLHVLAKKQLPTGEVVGFTKRTTVTFPNELAELICCLSNVDPFAEIAHGAVRRWLQTELDGWTAVIGTPVAVSQFLRMRAINAIAKPHLVNLQENFQLRRYEARRASKESGTVQ